LRGPVEDYLRREMAAVEEEMEWLSEAYSPFRQSGDA
jgi:predicted N-acyltransferase